MSDNSGSRSANGYSAVWTNLRRYWKAYGGAKAAISSPFLHLSILLSAVSFDVWLGESWWETPISVLPNILGFSLGGYAIWLAWGDVKFRKIIAGRAVYIIDGVPQAQNNVSPYLAVSAMFAHFILVQLVSLMYALVARSLYFPPDPGTWLASLASSQWFAGAAVVGSAVGYWLFIYSLATALAAVLAIFRITFWHDEFYTNERLRDAARSKKDS